MGRWRGRFFRRIGCAFALLLLLLVLGSTALSWLIASAAGGTHLAGGAGILIQAASLLIVIGGFAGVVFAGRALRRAAMPVGDLLEASDRVAGGDYSTRVEERGPGEVRALAHAFNSMAAKLQTDDEQRRRLLADVTHELRTPITIIQGNLEGMLDGIYPAGPERIQSILEETRMLSRVIDDLRTLSLA
ncbi:MAG: HAMP domain-containing protein, partial [Chloroflexi bacterium]